MKNYENELKNTSEKFNDSKTNSKFISQFKKRKYLEREVKKDQALRILFDVCAYYNTPWTQVLSPYRGPKVVKIRKVASYVIKEKTNLVFGQIGQVMRIDRTSVGRNHSIIKAVMEDKRNSELKKDINNILMVTF